MPTRILIIEDDTSTATALQKVLMAEGYAVDVASRGDTGLQRATDEFYHVVLTDLKLPGLDGLQLVERLHAAKPKVPIIMMTAHGTTETAIEATRLGAYEYLVKPFEADTLLDLVASVASQSEALFEIVEMGQPNPARSAIIGNSRIMQNIYKEIGRIAPTSVTVLIRGATGTGKELVARALYQYGNRKDKPFIAVNCAAIPDALLESELFGHERGAFTGALQRRIGRFEQAGGGTLFLDEVGDLQPGIQAKLLRVLQEKSIRRLGGNEEIPVDVRVIAATHRDLEAAIAEKDFREDLFYRLNVATIFLPPLSQRTEDIPDLVRYFIRRHAVDLGVLDPSIHPDALDYLKRQDWLGNVRELENAVRQALLLAKPFPIGLSHAQQVMSRARQAPDASNQSHAAYVAHLLDQVCQGEESNAYARMIADLETELFTQAIQRAHGNQAQAARWLGVTRLKMREKLSALGLRPPPVQDGMEPLKPAE